MTSPNLYDGKLAAVASREASVVSLTVEPGDAVDEEFRQDLRRARRAIASAEPGAVVLTGDPDAFAVAPDDCVATVAVAATVPSGTTQLVFDAIASLDCPVVGALRGQVSDAGFALGLSADLRVGSETSTYGVPAVDDGRVASDHVSQRLEATVGRERSEELLSTVGHYDAGTVAEWGLLNEVVADDAVVDRALAMAEEFARRPVVPYRYMKWAVDTASPVRKSGYEFEHAEPDPLPSVVDEMDLFGEGERSSGETVTVDEPREGIGRVTLDRRRRLNAISGPMFVDFRDAIDDLAARDPDAVVVEGAGQRAFSIGLDTRAPIARTANPADGATISRLGQEMADVLASLRFPVVAAISGRAFGGGLELALAADVRVGGESSTYSFPEVTHGLLPAAGGTQRLPASVGTGRAKEMLFTGGKFDAETMAEWGVLWDVVPDEDVTETALDLAERLAENGTGLHERPSFGMEDCPTAEGYVLERAGLGHAFGLDPFDVVDGDARQ